MGSIPDEVVAETAQRARRKRNIGRCSEKEKYRTGIPPTEFEELETAARADPSGNGQNHRGTSVRDRPAGGRNGQRPASGQNGSVRIVRREGRRQMERERTEDDQEGRPAGNRRPEEGQRGGFRQNRPADGRNGQRPSSAPNGQRGNRRQDEGQKWSASGFQKKRQK